jgi:hypothetical protein
MQEAYLKIFLMFATNENLYDNPSSESGTRQAKSKPKYEYLMPRPKE